MFHVSWKELKNYEVGPKEKSLDTYWFEETIEQKITP